MPGSVIQWFRSLVAGKDGTTANQLYVRLVEQARSPAFYLEASVPDTIDGRFDMIAIHMFLVMHRLKNLGSEVESFSQQLFDEMFADMDRGLREMGVGDMGVGRRVRAMGKAFMGRVEAYDEAAEDPDLLKQALARNLYRGEDVDEASLASMAGYLAQEMDGLAAQDADAIMNGQVSFGSLQAVTANDEGAGA